MNLFGEPEADERAKEAPATLEDEIAAQRCLVCGSRMIVVSRQTEWCVYPACGTRIELTIPIKAATKTEERFRERRRPGVIPAPTIRDATDLPSRSGCE